MIKTYSELSRIETFLERFHYLELEGEVGRTTFGFDRWINQRFYKSREWQDVRDAVIVRDNGCDLGIEGYEIRAGLLVHHMNPFMVDDVVHGKAWIIDPEYLITTSLQTHNAIHYGGEWRLPQEPVVRKRGDTTLW